MDRYARQRKAVGGAAHRRIREAKVLVVGLGGLGCPAASYLVGAGVGTVGLCDSDKVDVTNLHRQPLYNTADVGASKVDAARSRLEALNPDCILLSVAQRVGPDNADDIVRGFDVVLDCTDSLDARYAISDACARAGVILVQGGIAAGEGEVAVLCGANGPCYRCLYPAAEEGPTCADEGIIGPLAGLVGCTQALWALQALAGDTDTPPGRMLLVASDGQAETVALKRRPGCEAHVQDKPAQPPAPVEGPACPMPWNAPKTADISVQDFAEHRAEFYLLDVREQDEWEEGHLAGATLVPLGQLPRRLTEMPKDRSIVVYCAVGGRSAHAAAFLRERGYDAHNMRGGMRAWMMAGLPVP